MCFFLESIEIDIVKTDKYRIFVKMCKIILIHCLIYYWMMSDMEMVSTERSENYEFNADHHPELLSRQRRYLTFPEGSSVQLGSFNTT